jgi:2-iminobutanoate/2-iminopropanoate deaminase
MEAIQTDAAPIVDAPLSQAIVHDGTVYVSGQVPVDPSTGEVVNGDIEKQVNQCFDNIEAILEAAGSSLDRVLRATVFMTDTNDFESINRAYAARVSEPFPARSAVEVSDLAIDIDIEIEVTAAL